MIKLRWIGKRNIRGYLRYWWYVRRGYVRNGQYVKMPRSWRGKLR